MTPKSCKYNKYPGPSAIKTALFLAIKLIFDTTATKTAVFLAGKGQSKESIRDGKYLIENNYNPEGVRPDISKSSGSETDHMSKVASMAAF